MQGSQKLKLSLREASNPPSPTTTPYYSHKLQKMLCVFQPNWLLNTYFFPPSTELWKEPLVVVIGKIY